MIADSLGQFYYYYENCDSEAIYDTYDEYLDLTKQFITFGHIEKIPTGISSFWWTVLTMHMDLDLSSDYRYQLAIGSSNEVMVRTMIPPVGEHAGTYTNWVKIG